MAHHFDIKQLEAIVHDENYPVLHWMKKVNATRQLRGDSRYWVFHTPLGDDWLKDGSARDSSDALPVATAVWTKSVWKSCGARFEVRERGRNQW